MHQIICSSFTSLASFPDWGGQRLIWGVASHKGKAASGGAAPCRLSTSLAGLDDCNTSACRAQIVTQTMPVRRVTLCEPQVPRDCPADVLKLIFDCTACIAEDRPNTKVQILDASGTEICGRPSARLASATLLVKCAWQKSQAPIMCSNANSGPRRGNLLDDSWLY